MEEIKIKADSHYSKIHFNPILFPNEIEFDFRFSDRSMYYSEPGSYLRTAVNKLCGLSFDLLGKNSARLGWRYNPDLELFEVLAYFHIDGATYWNEANVFRIKKGVTWTCEIHRTRKSGKDEIGVMLKASNGSYELLDYIQTPFKHSIIGYRQMPYFGGEETLPHSIYLELGVKK